MLDEPTMSDQTLLLSVEDLINLAMGPIAGNTVDFKMLKTILHILARQMRLLEQKVVLEVGELPQNPVLRLSRRDQDDLQSSSTEGKWKDTTSLKKKPEIGDKERRERSPFGDKGEESEGSVDSYEMEELREEAQRAKDKEIMKVLKAKTEKERAKAEREKMEQMDPASREEYKKELQKEQEQREKAEKLAEEEEERAEKEARAQREKARAEREKVKAEKSRLRLEKENELAEKEREIFERESDKMGKMSPNEKIEYQKQLEKEKEQRLKALRFAQDEEERVEKEKARAERDKARAEKEKERAERERAIMENMSPKEKESYQQELEKVQAEREEEIRKLNKMDPKEREQYEKAQYKERERERFKKMSPSEKVIYEQEVQKKKDEQEKIKMENISPKEREQYMEEKEKLAKLEKMSPKEREKYEKEQQKEKAKLEKMSPKDREKYEKQQQKETAEKDSDKSEKEKVKLEKMSRKEREKYEKEQQNEKEKANIEKMSPKEKEKYEKQQQKEKETTEKEKAKIEKMSPKEREKYEKEKEKENAEKDSDKSEKEKAKLEKMSPKEREKYEKEQQKEKERARKELEREKAKMEKMSPEEREKYVKEKEKAEREARDKSRAEESAKLGDIVESISEKYDTKLKEKVLVVEKGPSSGRGSELKSRRSSIEVVTRSQFALLEAAVESLKDSTSPLPALTLPDNNQLRTDLAKGSVSLTDAMMAMQVSARVQAAEQAIGRLGGVLTQLAGRAAGPDQGGLPAGPAGLADGDERGSRVPGTRAQGKATPSTMSHKSMQMKDPGPLTAQPSHVSTATDTDMGKLSDMSKGPSSMALTQYEMDAALDALRKELMEKVNAITSRALSTAETTSNLAKSVVDKMDVALQIDDRISTLNTLVSEYTEQLAGFDAGLTTQMQSFREQMTQMRGDLSAGLKLLESANNNAETAAMMELTERYEELVNGLDNTLLAHQALSAFQDQLNLDFRSLLESVEMLREQKADRDEVIDGLRDKADNERLAGLLREADFNEARAELDQQLAVCHDKFRKQDAVWVAALKELTAVVQRKAEHTDLLKTRQETTQQLQEIEDKIRRLAFILGEPKAAILTRKLAKDALCAVCLVPALMDPEDPSSGKPPLLPAAPRPRALGDRAAPAAAEEPCIPEWKPPEAPDLRTHTCLRWVGGSHTLLTAAKRGHCEHPLAPPTTTHKFLGQGDDGKMYSMESELQPCEECNQPLHCSEGGPCPTLE